MSSTAQAAIAAIEKEPDNREVMEAFGRTIIRAFDEAAQAGGVPALKAEYPKYIDSLREHISLGRELLRDYYELILPGADMRVEYEPTAEDHTYRRGVEQRKEELIERLDELKTIEGSWTYMAGRTRSKEPQPPKPAQQKFKL